MRYFACSHARDLNLIVSLAMNLGTVAHWESIWCVQQCKLCRRFGAAQLMYHLLLKKAHSIAARYSRGGEALSLRALTNLLTENGGNVQAVKSCNFQWKSPYTYVFLEQKFIYCMAIVLITTGFSSEVLLMSGAIHFSMYLICYQHYPVGCLSLKMERKQQPNQ